MSLHRHVTVNIESFRVNPEKWTDWSINDMSAEKDDFVLSSITFAFVHDKHIYFGTQFNPIVDTFDLNKECMDTLVYELGREHNGPIMVTNRKFKEAIKNADIIYSYEFVGKCKVPYKKMYIEGQLQAIHTLKWIDSNHMRKIDSSLLAKFNGVTEDHVIEIVKHCKSYEEFYVSDFENSLFMYASCKKYFK